MSVVVPDQIDRDTGEPVVPWSRPSPLRPLPRRVAQFLVPYAFVAPAVALLGLLGIYTILYGIELSFVQWTGLSRIGPGSGSLIMPMSSGATLWCRR